MSTGEGFPLVTVTGRPYERGLQQGRAVPDRIAGSIALYRDQLGQRGVNAGSTDALARNLIDDIAAFDASYLDEMRGMADGAGVGIEDIILINCRTEMLFGHAALGPARMALDDGCTNLVVLPGSAESGRVMHAHNWDWCRACAFTGIVLRILKQGDGPDMLMFTEAGTLGRHGFNSAGISLSGNFLACDRDFQRAGTVPLGLLRRKMLESDSIAGAMRTLFSTRRFCSNNLMLADSGGEAVDLECAPDEIFWLTPENGFLVHANHWLSQPARGKLVDVSLAAGADSVYRHQRVTGALMAGQEPIGWERVKAALADRSGMPNGVLSMPAESRYNSYHCTVATTLMDPAAGTMWIARKPYEAINFVEYRL